MHRSLNNPLTFATINLDRLAAGAYTHIHGGHSKLAWTLGWDGRLQHDDRRNTKSHTVVLEQEERVHSLSLFGMLHFGLSRGLRATAGARWDAIRFAMKDLHLSNGNQSGHRTMIALSPAAGVAYTTRHLVIYGNVGTAFETPTTTELVNRPDTDGGFHPTLGPQHTRGL